MSSWGIRQYWFNIRTVIDHDRRRSGIEVCINISHCPWCGTHATSSDKRAEYHLCLETTTVVSSEPLLWMPSREEVLANILPIHDWMKRFVNTLENVKARGFKGLYAYILNTPWASYQISKLGVVHAPGTFSPRPTSKDTVPWRMSGSLTRGGGTFPAHTQPAILLI